MARDRFDSDGPDEPSGAGSFGSRRSFPDSVTKQRPWPPRRAGLDGADADTVALVEPPAPRPTRDSLTLTIAQPSTRMSASAGPLQAPQVTDVYRLSEPIGTGGMATVHLAVAAGAPSRIVAIKRLHPQFAADEYFAKMLLDEAAIASRIRHENVVTMYGASVTDDELLLVMDYSAGLPLAGMIGAVHPDRIQPAIVAAIMAGALRGLHAAHEAVDDSGRPLGIIHRDVSPQNIHVGFDGVARVIDFGIAKAEQRMQVTRVGEVKGKLAYMAPEQLLSRPVDRRVDVRAAGVVMWETLTSSPLFHAESESKTIAKVVAGCTTPPSELATDVPHTLDEVVLRALALEPDDRFATALEMAEAIEAAMGDALARRHEVAAWVNVHGAETLAHHRELAAKLLGSVGSRPGPTEREVTAIIPAGKLPATRSGRIAPEVTATLLAPTPPPSSQAALLPSAPLPENSDRYAVTFVPTGRHQRPEEPSPLSPRGRLVLEALLILTMVILVAYLAATLLMRVLERRREALPPHEAPTTNTGR